MKRCKICHVEAELDENGRCRSCRMAYEATEIHRTTYGKYAAMVAANRVAVNPPERTAAGLLTRECKYCGKEFPKSGTRLYCSDYCRYMHHRGEKKAKEEPVEQQKCPVCHRMFTPHRRGNIYCGAVCSTSKAAKYLRWNARKRKEISL